MTASAPSAVELLRELGERAGDFLLSTPEVASDRVTLVDPLLTQWFGAQQMANVNAWVYCPLSGDTGNVGYERRASSWSFSDTALHLYNPGFPEPIQSGVYEIHMRWPRSRKLAALNSGVALLGNSWFRTVYAKTVTTRDNTYVYALDPTVNWQSFTAIELQITTDPSQIGFPYESTESYNPSITSHTDEGGVTTWYLQFGTLPPSGRAVRILATVGYDTLVGDGDVLPLDNSCAGPAVEWLYEYALHKLNVWDANRQPTGQLERALQLSQAHLMKALQDLKDYAKAGSTRRLIVPGHGTRTYSSLERGPGLAAYKMVH